MAAFMYNLELHYSKFCRHVLVSIILLNVYMFLFPVPGGLTLEEGIHIVRAVAATG